MENKLKLKNATLTLRPVTWMAILPLLREFGGVEALLDPDTFDLANLEAGDAAKYAEATERLFNYCAGWGVEDDPPAEAIEELAELGVADAGKPHLARAHWLRFSVLEGDDEASQLIGAVLALSVPRGEVEEESGGRGTEA